MKFALTIATLISLAASISAHAWTAQKEPTRTGTKYYFTSLGSNANNGTSATACGAGCGPWQTPAALVGKTFGPGDQLLFNGGETFTGTVQLYAPCCTTNKYNPLLISSYGTGRATVDIGAGAFAAFDIYNFSFVEVRNINCVGGGPGGTPGHCVSFYFDTTAGPTAFEHFVVDGSDISAATGTDPANGSLPSDGGIGLLVYSDTGTTVAHVTVTNAAVHDNLLTGISIGGLFDTKHLSDVYVGYSSGYNNTGLAGLSAGNVSGDGIRVTSVSNAIVERSTAYNNGANHNAAAGPCGMWTFNSDHVTFQFNESYDNKTAGTFDGCGIDLDGGSSNNVVQYNYTHGNYGTGYQSGSFDGGPSNSNNVFRYNVSENDARTAGDGVGQSSMYFFAGTGASVDGLDVYNNTIYSSLGPNTVNCVAVLNAGITNVRIRNNVCQTTGGKPLLYIPAPATGLMVQGNVYWPTGDVFHIKYGGTDYVSLSAFRAATGQEKNPLSTGVSTGFNADPLLTSPGTGGTVAPAATTTLGAYLPQATSPTIDAGLNLSALFSVNPGPFDFNGRPIPNGAGFDVGAVERVPGSYLLLNSGGRVIYNLNGAVLLNQ